MRGPFLTDIDSRAAIKGSRDPLGLQSIWTRFGRHVVGNLTTVSTSVPDFTTLLLGYYFVERVAERAPDESELAVFLKWEQLAAYARAVCQGDSGFRGTERVHQNLSKDHRVTLSAERAHQILGNQKIYGLWGLYTVPSRTSGMVDGSPPRLTPETRAFVERTFLPRFSAAGLRDGRAIEQRLAEPTSRLDTEKRDRPFLDAVATAWQRRRPAAERDFYRDHLLFGGPTDPTHGRQEALAHLLSESEAEKLSFSPATVRHLVKRAGKGTGPSQALADRLVRICHCEALIGPSSALFGFLLHNDGSSVDAVATAVRKAWGKRVPNLNPVALEELKGELGAGEGSAEEAGRWMRLATAYSEGDYASALRLLLDQNRATMSARGNSAPWVVEEAGVLRVRVPDEPSRLPTGAELAEQWRFPYFLESLRAVSVQLRAN